MATKVLYVCTYWGVRSQIARLLTNALHEPDLIAESAGFESGTIGALPRQLMSERGLDLSSESPESLFKFARKKANYDYVVTLCNRNTQENYQVLFNVVDLLFGDHAEIIHWNIADFMSIKVSGDARIAAAEKIVTDIEKEVVNFVAQIRKQRALSG